MAATTAPRRPATPYVAPVTITAFELEVVFGVDADEPDDEPPAGAVVVGLLAAVVPAVVAPAAVVPALVATVAGVADPFKQLVLIPG